MGRNLRWVNDNAGHYHPYPTGGELAREFVRSMWGVFGAQPPLVGKQAEEEAHKVIHNTLVMWNERFRLLGGQDEPNRLIEFTADEIEALKEFFPRVPVANIVREGTPLQTALQKLCPTLLPNRLR